MTGVQTCALPISGILSSAAGATSAITGSSIGTGRSPLDGVRPKSAHMSKATTALFDMPAPYFGDFLSNGPSGHPLGAGVGAVQDDFGYGIAGGALIDHGVFLFEPLAGRGK